MASHLQTQARRQASAWTPQEADITTIEHKVSFGSKADLTVPKSNFRFNSAAMPGDYSVDHTGFIYLVGKDAAPRSLGVFEIDFESDPLVNQFTLDACELA
jgi:hypothetical protein